MSADWIADDLRAAGLTVVEAPGWKFRGKDALTPRVVVVHHTAGAREGDAPSLNVCINGRADLPGPLCHVLISRSGVCHVVAGGVANHAGPGSWRGVSGNTHALGIEAENTGRGEPWPTKQLVAFEMCAAVLVSHIGRDESWVIGHKEWTPRKIDPAGVDMDTFRAAVRLILEDDMDPVLARKIDEIHKVLVQNRVDHEHDATGAGHDLATPILATNGRQGPIQTLLDKIARKIGA